MNFLEVLLEWGCAWMWDEMKVVGGEEWLWESIEANSLVAVTEGSFIKQVYPGLCLACFVLECTQGRGRLIESFAKNQREQMHTEVSY